MTLTIGIIGGGQLGRMMVEAGHRLGYKMIILDNSQATAGKIADLHLIDDIQNISSASKQELNNKCDVITYEVEHVDVSLPNTFPTTEVMQLLQDKYTQKQYLQNYVPVVPGYTDPTNIFGKVIVKKRKGSYDGKGNFEHATDHKVSNEFYYEPYIDFEFELAVMVVRQFDNSIISYPVVYTEQRNSMCHSVILTPLHLDIKEKAKEIAEKAIAGLPEGAIGIFGVEMFYTKDHQILINEIAPRPHNSGHYTQATCNIDQFEAHLRAITNQPINIETHVQYAAMINIIGQETLEETMEPFTSSNYYWYNKEFRKGRKLGHCNILANSYSELYNKITPYTNFFKFKPVDVYIIMGSKTDMEIMQKAANLLDDFDVSYVINIVSAHRTPHRMYNFATTASSYGTKIIIAGAGGAAHLPGMVAALTTLPVIGVPIPSTVLHGQDSLLSIVQMPKGIPVATVAIGGAENAALLACRMLAMNDSKLTQKLMAYSERQAELAVSTL